MALAETNILSDIMRKCCKGATRLFRNNIGTAWMGKALQVVTKGLVTVYPGDVVLRNAQKVKFGVCNPGGSDAIGWTTIIITPEMVGRKVAVFTAAEVKTNVGVVRKEQKNFIAQVVVSGGIAGVCRSAKDFVEMQNNWTGGIK